MNIIKLILGACYTNCYIVSSEYRNCIIIDPADDKEKIIDEIEKNKLNPQYIFLTHGHTDHILAASDLKNKYKIPVIISKLDAWRLADEALINSRPYVTEPYKKVIPDILIQENDEIWLDELKFQFYGMPGHTEGSLAIILEDKIFTGDTLLKENHGKTSLLGGDEQLLIQSIRKLAQLEGNYNIYPGHREETTLDHEKKYNPFLER